MHESLDLSRTDCEALLRSTVVGRLARIRTLSRPDPWAAGAREMHLRLTWDELSGRQLGARSDPVSDLPVRRGR